MSALLLSKRYASGSFLNNQLFIKEINSGCRLFRASFYLAWPLRYAKNCIGYLMKLFTFFFAAFYGTGKRALTQKEGNDH